MPPPVSSGDDGRIEFRLPRSSPGLRIVAEQGWVVADGVVDPGGLDPDELRGGVYDLGDIYLVRGYRVAGRAVDQEGNPVDGLSLDFDGTVCAIRAGRFDCTSTRRGSG